MSDHEECSMILPRLLLKQCFGYMRQPCGLECCLILLNEGSSRRTCLPANSGT